MSERSTSALPRKIAELTGRSPSKQNDGVDELNALLLQIVLAVMLIFMIAFFLFMSKVDGEISRIDEMHRKLAEAEYAEWLRTLDKVTESQRIAYGLKAFLHIDPVTGVKSYDFSEMISGGRLVASAPRRRAFCLGAAAAHRDYSRHEKLEKRWVGMLEKMMGRPVKSGAVREAVNERIRLLRAEVAEVQALAAVEIQRHFAAHPEALNDPGVRRLLTRIDREKDGQTRKTLMEELSRTLRRQAYGHLQKMCGVPMLEDER